MTLAERYAEKFNVSKKEAQQILANVGGTIHDALDQDGRAVLNNIGIIKVVERDERKGRNPQTGKNITIPAHKTVKMTPCKGYKEYLNK